MRISIGLGFKVLKDSKTVLVLDKLLLYKLFILKTLQLMIIGDKKQKDIKVHLSHGYTIFMTVGHPLLVPYTGKRLKYNQNQESIFL